MSERQAGMFAERKPEGGGMSPMVWMVAGLAVLLLIGGLIVAGRKKPGPALNAVLPLDPYAASLALSKIAMSESTSLSGGKSTFIDGVVKNTGPKTVTAATVQVLFANDMQLPPEVQTVPLMVIRSREPYIDAQMLSASPLKPGDEREFRLIFETVGGNWNTQIPEIHVTHAETR